MAATVYMSESNGAAASETVTDNISNLNFGSADLPNLVPADHPIIIGANSYGKWLRVRLADLGGSSQIANLKFYKASGAYVTGESIGGNLPNESVTYANMLIGEYATYRTGTTGSNPITVPVVDGGQEALGGLFSEFPVPTSVPASENLHIGSSPGGALSAPGYSEYLLLGLCTTASTPAGDVNQKVFRYQWDET